MIRVNDVTLGRTRRDDSGSNAWRARRRTAALAVLLILPVSNVTVAFAQAPAAGAAPGAGAPAGAAPGGAPAAAAPAAVPNYGGFVAPPPPGQPLGGGNATESSARTIRGDETDGFDLGPKSSGGGGSVYGGSDGPIFTGGSHVVGGDVNTQVHVVRKGETLWAICDSYFHNPYQWPRIWSYNPQIQNPHWIFPNDLVKLRPGAQLAGVAGSPATAGSLVDRRRQVPPDTIFLRDEGFIDDDTTMNYGEITGAREDKLFMTDFDEVYLRIAAEHDVKVGQELTIFRPVRSATAGRVIEFQGTVRVDQWNEKERVARAQVIEALNVIERGARVGPITRRFEVVPPLRNTVDLRASVLSSIHAHPFYGQNQVIFLDRGEQEGLHPGNRLFIVRRGDAYHQSVVTGSAARRIAIESESPAEVERVPRREDRVYPEEVVGELRVLAVRGHTSTAMVTRATREIELNDVAVARKGY